MVAGQGLKAFRAYLEMSIAFTFEKEVAKWK
jgi:hypothetical protein